MGIKNKIQKVIDEEYMKGVITGQSALIVRNIRTLSKREEDTCKKAMDYIPHSVELREQGKSRGHDKGGGME